MIFFYCPKQHIAFVIIINIDCKVTPLQEITYRPVINFRIYLLYFHPIRLGSAALCKRSFPEEA